MIKFLMPFHDVIEQEVLYTKRVPHGICREELTDRIASHFPNKNIVFAENARIIILHLMKHLAASAGRPISTAIGTMMCGSVLAGVNTTGPVLLMDSNEHWQPVIDSQSCGADVLLFAGLCGKRMEPPERGHKAQILIDDSAQCFDRISGFSDNTDYSLFSFGAGKQMYANGGGILWSGHHDLSAIAASLNYAMPDWQLFLIASQLEKIDTINAQCRGNALYLIHQLQNVSWLSLPDPASCHFLKFTVRIDRGTGAARQNVLQFIRHMSHAGIEVEHWYTPLHIRFPDAFTDLRMRDFNANTLWSEAITLPCRPQLLRPDLDMIVEAVKSFRPNMPDAMPETLTNEQVVTIVTSFVEAQLRRGASFEAICQALMAKGADKNVAESFVTRISELGSHSSSNVECNSSVVNSEHNKWETLYTPSMLNRPTAGDYFSSLFDLKNKIVRDYGKGKKILDLGCGTGAHLLPLLSDGYDVVGVDFVTTHLNTLRAQWLASGGSSSRLRTIAADITTVPEPPESYDLIYSFSTLYYISSIDAILAEIARLLRSGGRAILEFGNRRSLADIEARRVPTGVRSYHVSPGVMRAALAHAGLSVCDEHVFQCAPLYGGATPQDRELNALLKSLLAVRVADGRMLDEVISSSPLMSPFAFRHLFVVGKGPATSMATKIPSLDRDVNQAQNLTLFAADLLAAGKKNEAVRALVRALEMNPDSSASALMLASLFEGAPEKLFMERMNKVVERWRRRNNIAPESLSSTHPDRYNPPPLIANPSIDARYQLMRNRVHAAKTVVDLGCGGYPIPEATCAVDLFLYPVERGSGAINREALKMRGIRFVHQAIDKPLPFHDREFDFAYSAHVFEHLTDPATACEEMMRIAKAGCVLTPYFVFDVLSGRTYHRWMMIERGGTLFFFEKEPHEDRPFGSWPNVIDAILNDGGWFKSDLGRAGYTMQSVLRTAYGSRAPLSEVCLNWEGRFEYMVIRSNGSIQSSRTIKA